MGKLEQSFMQKKPLLLCNMKIERILDKKKALRLCVRKLKKISDPESKLCKAVLINNTLQLLKSSEDIKLQNGKKPEEEISKCLPNVQNPPSYSPEDILSEIVLPPPLLPQLEQFTCRGFNKPMRFGDQQILTVSEKDCITNLVNGRTLVKQRSSCFYFENDFVPNFGSEGVPNGVPSTDITLEEIDYNNGFGTDYSLYNSFTDRQH